MKRQPRTGLVPIDEARVGLELIKAGGARGLHRELPENRRHLRPARSAQRVERVVAISAPVRDPAHGSAADRKSTRLNSSHGYISYAVFCLKKKKNQHNSTSAMT